MAGSISTRNAHPRGVVSDVRLRAVADALPHITIGGALGSGLGGSVFAGAIASTAEPVAIKLLADAAWRDAVARERIRTEGELLTTCRHPHVVRGIAFYELEDMSLLVMERVPGETLLDRCVGSRPSVAEARDVLLAVARALQHVHALGFLHGDIKPEHVLLAQAGAVRLIDFGLARRWPFNVERQVAGTPWYMAPEAIRAGGSLLPATDVYALGMMAYELLAGHLPYPPAEGAIGIMRQQLELAPFDLAIAAPGLPRDLSALVMAAIDKRLEHRIASAEEFATRLASIALDLTTHDRAVPPMGR